MMGLFNSLLAKPRSQELYCGGSGTSKEDAVVITAMSSSEGIRAEYTYIEEQCGRKDKDWMLVASALLTGRGGRHYDLIAVKLTRGPIRKFYFDITAFYGRF